MSFGTYLTLRRLRREGSRRSEQKQVAPASELPAISILKPLKGIDEGLAENLKSFFELQYPNYEVIFAVADANDPAIAVAESVISANISGELGLVRRPAQILVGEEVVGLNPKINNLVRAYDYAENDLILISDSNVRARSMYLQELAQAIASPDVGLVTALVAGVNAQGFGGNLEASFLNSFCARGMSIAFFAGRPIVVGKSMLFRKSLASRFGGLRSLGSFLAEDYVAGRLVEKLGYRVVLTQDTVDQHLGAHSLKQFWSRHVRWGRLRRTQAPFFFPLELLQNSVVTCFIGAIAVPSFFSVGLPTFIAAHLGFWAACDWALMRRMGRTGLRETFAWIAREFLSIPLYIQIYMNNTVQWRGQRLRLRAGGVLE